jgi:hypothetical protein
MSPESLANSLIHQNPIAQIKKALANSNDIASDCPNMNKHEEDLQLQQIKN